MIGKNIIQRWYDLVPETLDAHALARTKIPRSSFDGNRGENLAPAARVYVDSYFGTTNMSDVENFYPVLNQVYISWEFSRKTNHLLLRLCTATPNFSHFSWRFDESLWRTGCDSVLSWLLLEGENRFEVKSINTANHEGAVTKITAIYSPGNSETPGTVQVLTMNGTARSTCYPFYWEDFTHPTLQLVRGKYKLDEIIEAGKNDLEKLVLLRDWVKSRWDHDQPIYSPPWDVNYILDHTDKKIESFYCVHYSIVFMQCCLALGIPARLINLHRGICSTPFSKRGYGRELSEEASPCDEHVVNEVWVDDLGKWVMMDVDFDIYYEKDSSPLNALDIHNTILENKLDQLVVHEGPYAWKLKSTPDFYQYKLPVYYRHVCVFWRNNHLSDPEGPDHILHWVDENTPWMLWWEGEDLRHRPQIIGPVGVSWPYSEQTPVLTDENMGSCWASSDDPEAHWVELVWDEPQKLHTVEILWANYWGRYFTSHKFELDAWIDDNWKQVVNISQSAEKAIDSLSIEEVETTRMRILQPAGGGSSEFPNRLWIAEIFVC